MENLKTYEDFVNEEIRWDVIGANIGAIIGMFLVVIPVVFVLAFLSMPYTMSNKYYLKFFKKDWRLFARIIQTSMDLLWSYSVKITKLEENDNLDEQLTDKQKKLLNKVKSVLMKKFGKTELTKDEIKEYALNMFNKISKEEDRELINRIIEDYEVRELQLDNKKIKSLGNILNVLDIRNIADVERRNIEDVDPFNDDWEEEEVGQEGHIGEDFYIMNMSKINNNKNFLGKATLEEGHNDNLRLGLLSVDKKEFYHALNKYYKQFSPYGKFIMTRLNGEKIKDTLVVISVDKRYLFEDIVQQNWSLIKTHFNASYKKVRQNEYSTRLKNMFEEMQPNDLIRLIDDGFGIEGVTYINIFDWITHPYLFGNAPRGNRFQDRLNRRRDMYAYGIKDV